MYRVKMSTPKSYYFRQLCILNVVASVFVSDVCAIGLSNIFQVSRDEVNPDENLDTPQIIRRHGYPAQSHVVETEDGYLLTIHRIPCGRGCRSIQKPSDKGDVRQPVLLQHGLLGSSADWIIPGPEKALAYDLVENGYDVWFGNARGNTYSKAHVKYSSTDAQFWEFSWNEMGRFDIPAVIDYINNVTETEGKLIYIGHSMGCTMGLVTLSTRPEYNQKLRAAFLLAPAAFMRKVKSPIRLLAPLSDKCELIARFFGVMEFLPQSYVLRWMSKFGCEIITTEKILCENMVFVLCGFDPGQYNTTITPVIFRHTPAGTSTRTVFHFAQEIAAGGDFRNYDYGAEENQKRYGEDTPPAYNLSAISLPIALHYAQNDWLAGPKDVNELFSRLPNPIGQFVVPLKEFNHVDFIWGIDARTLLYGTVLNQMKPYAD